MTHMTREPVPVDHDYSRLLPSLLCNDVQSGILDM